jgi:hypothetical protein
MAQVHFYPRAQAALDRRSHEPFDLYGLLGATLDAVRDEISPELLVAYLDQSYRHGGGWHDFAGFTLNNFDSDHPTLTYPGDPPTEAVCYWQVGEARVILFDHAWVAVATSNDSFRVARMD